MSDQSQFIKEAFYLIRNSFEEFTNKKVNISLKIIDLENWIEDFDGARVNCQFYPKKVFEISIMSDIEILKNKKLNIYNYLVERNRIFLESNGIPINEYSLLLGLIIHEFGHIYHQLHWIEYFNIYMYENLYYITDVYCDTIIRCMDEDFEYSPFSLQYIFTEIFAESFKFRHFLKFWGLLNRISISWVPYKETELIEK